MKLLWIMGDAAVGKMTVGQELAKITDLRLFHNHMTIEPVIEIFGFFNKTAVIRLRDVIFEEYAKTENYGMIFTCMFAFDWPSEWEYLRHVNSFFEPYGTEFYYAELVAPQEIRLQRNASENRLLHKPSKRDLETSRARLIADNEKARLVSLDGEMPFDNYIKIDNSNIPPEVVARLIKERFAL
jgi:hypothetical protein